MRHKGTDEDTVTGHSGPDVGDQTVTLGLPHPRRRASRRSRSRGGPEHSLRASTQRATGTSTVARAHRSPPETLAAPSPSSAISAAPTSAGVTHAILRPVRLTGRAASDPGRRGPAAAVSASAVAGVAAADAGCSRASFSCRRRMPCQSASGPGRAAGHVHVDRDQLVHALGHRVRVPVRAAAVGSRRRTRRRTSGRASGRTAASSPVPACR